MLAIDKDYTTAIYSLGKTGTTAIAEALSKVNWYTSGEEHITWLKTKYVDDVGRSIDQQEAFFMAVEWFNCKPIVVVRQPWKRFVSGFKEILQDYISGVHPDLTEAVSVMDKIFDDKQRLTHLVNRVFYLAEVPHTYSDPANPLDWGTKQFSLFYNYHTRNFLNIIDQYPGCRVVDSKQVNDLILEFGGTPMITNVSRKQHLAILEEVLMNCSKTDVILRYIEPEIKYYNELKL